MASIQCPQDYQLIDLQVDDETVTILQDQNFNIGNDASVDSINATLIYAGNDTFTAKRFHTGFNIDFLNTQTGHSAAAGQRLIADGAEIDVQMFNGAAESRALVSKNRCVDSSLVVIPFKRVSMALQCLVVMPHLQEFIQ